MTTRPFSRFNLWLLVWFTCAYLVWTVLTLRAGLFAAIDASSDTARLQPDSPAAQIAAAFTLVSHPLVLCVGLMALGIWAWRGKLRHLATASIASGLLSWGAAVLVANSVQRPRPPSPLSTALTYSGYAYPDAHMAVVTAAAAVVITTITTTRRPPIAMLVARLSALAFIVASGLAQWSMNEARISDLVGGMLLGGTVVTAVLFVARVRMLPVMTIRRQASTNRPHGGLCAVIYNPHRMADEMVFRRQIANELAGEHWEAPLWLPTTPDDAGQGMVATALSRGADLVIGAGGDGTIRVIAQSLAGSGVPFGIVPSGTGNLLAKNLGIPLDREDAIRVAVKGRPRAIDLVKLVVDGRSEAAMRFGVMAGIGFDARLMSRTNESLKRLVGSAAYVVSAVPELLVSPHRVEITVDGVRQVRRKAVLTVMGNVASIGGGLELMPDADPTDGRMEMVIGSPTGLFAWARTALQVITRGRAGNSLEQYTGQQMSVRVDEPMPYELDGDTVGEGCLFEAEVDPGALVVMAPLSSASHS
ncbi:diacylglycerol kinase family protein [Propionibacterium cyclohexanicum]|nr:diacylglycerol kinase family protein [Propionibacterium cyclohexanicum]